MNRESFLKVSRNSRTISKTLRERRIIEAFQHFMAGESHYERTLIVSHSDCLGSYCSDQALEIQGNSFRCSHWPRLGRKRRALSRTLCPASSVIIVIRTRAQLMERKCAMETHAMRAVKARLSSLQGYIVKADLEACYLNRPTDTVIEGQTHEINAFVSILGNSRLQCVELEASFAFYTSQIESILNEFENCARDVVLNCPSTPSTSPLLEQIVENSSILGHSYLRRACLTAVHSKVPSFQQITSTSSIIIPSELRSDHTSCALT